MSLKDYRERGKNNKNNSIKSEFLVSSFLRGSIVCQHIDIVWKNMPIEVRYSTIKPHNTFNFRLHKTEALYYVFVGHNSNKNYFWVMPTQLKFLKRRKGSINLPLYPNKINAYFYKYKCKANEIGIRLKKLHLNRKRWKISY